MKKETRAELLRTLFELRGSEYAKCFAPPGGCAETAIRAHSVQNAQVLDLLVTEGHVMTPVLRMNAETPPTFSLARVGRNRATTFAGLCAAHDSEMFVKIDSAPIEPSDPESAFLLAYRAVLYELHACCAAAVMLQLGYQRRVQLGLDTDEAPSPAGLLALDRMMVAYQTFTFKLRFDAAHAARDFTRLSHDIVELPVTRPTLAASAMFSLDSIARDNEPIRATVTVMPVNRGRTVALFSYMAEDAALARAELAPVLGVPGDSAHHALSVRLLNNCQNFVIAPDYFASWSPQKREAISSFFAATLVHDDLGNTNPDLQLFEAMA
jgi:hypothetical protein